MNRIVYSIIAFLSFSISIQAQTGEIQGKVTDEKGEPVPFAQLQIVTDASGAQTTSRGAKANMNGLYVIKGLPAGKYNLRCKALNKKTEVETDIEVIPGRTTTIDFVLSPSGSQIKGRVDIKTKRQGPKIINAERPKETIIGEAEIKESAVRDVNSLASSTGGIISEDVGAALSAGGGRTDGVTYIIDGVKVQGGAPNIAPGTIRNIDVAISGVPAKYGDANSGVIAITTKGPSEKFRGQVEGLTSQFLDPYGRNLLGFNVMGPILFKKDTTAMPDPKTKKRRGESILGYFLSGEIQTDGDRFPSINGNWKVKDDVFQKIQDDPYRVSGTGTELLLNQAFLTQNDLEKTNSHQNTSGRTFRLQGKLVYKPGKPVFTLGARYDDDQYNDFIQRYSLLNFQNNRVIINKGMSGFFNFYMDLYDREKQDNNLFQNTNITLQADFARSGQTYSSPVGGFDPWSYGYIGEFKEITQKQVVRTEGGNGTRVFYAPNQYLLFGDNLMTNSFTPVGINYKPGTINPLAAAQTGHFIRMYEQNIKPLTSINELGNVGGVINGNRANITVFDLFYPAARIYNGIQKEENDQYRLTGAINFDIINKKSKDFIKHTIEAGFELEQRVNSVYQISPGTLWTTAQSALLNSHLSPDNTHNYNPMLIMRNGSVKMRLQDYIKQMDTGILFSPFDSIFYDVEVSDGNQTNFSKNLRQELGYDSLLRLNIHEMDPSKMRLEWLSPDDLINNAFGITGYGYDVYGNKLGMSTKFNDFFTAKDSKGNLKREAAPYMPRYGAGYIQDKFQYKDVTFNIGFRLDYFDANSMELKDPYTPQGGRTIQDPDVKTKFGSKIPTNLPEDAAVYVDNETAPGRITGFRSGNKWFDKNGNELLGPDVVRLETGGEPKPYLIGNTKAERDKRVMGSSTFDPDLIFQQSTAKFALAPRINFSFAIDTQSLLFAHYDVLNQRPEQGATVVNALDYYNLVQRSQFGTINNPGLGFSSTSDLELGFKQSLTKISSLTINFMYREYSNMVSLARINGGYPGSYNTWGNTDFQTVKSIGLAYEMRRNKNLRLKANYTMQFSEGTGSSRTAQANIINAGLGNVKFIFPMDNDTRHNFNFNANYSFEGGLDGNNKPRYLGPKKLEKVLQNLGITLDLNLRSGTPYSLQSNATPESFMNSTVRAVNLGDLNSGSLPWRYNVNLKIDKDFMFKFGKSTAVDANNVPKPQKEYGLNIYLQITNLLNTSNTLRVFRYTGNAASDGYLNSDAGILQYNQYEATSKGYGQAFRDLYNVAQEIPGDRTSMYARPRTIMLGAIMSF